MTWNEEAHPRNGDGEFTHRSAATWARRVASAMPPVSLARGYRRVGDHPRGVGKVGGEDAGVFSQSTHPLAGGLWIDPQRPGTRHAPRYVNDFGVAVTGLIPKKHNTELHRGAVKGRRREGLFGDPEGLNYRETRRGGVAVGDRLGYGDAPEAFNARRKRDQARARLEQPRSQQRRTPRGTHVSGWMDKVGGQIARTRGEGR